MWHHRLGGMTSQNPGQQTMQKGGGMASNSTPSAPFGRPRQRPLPESGTVRIQVTLPAVLVNEVYAQAEIERRHLSDIHRQALAEYFANHPPETWRHIG